MHNGRCDLCAFPFYFTKASPVGRLTAFIHHNSIVRLSIYASTIIWQCVRSIWILPGGINPFVIILWTEKRKRLMTRSWSSKTKINGYINTTTVNHCRRLSIWWYPFVRFMHTAHKISSFGINQDALLSCRHNIIRVQVHDMNEMIILWVFGSLANTSIPSVSIVPLNLFADCVFGL